jgi:hypothetical protein
MRWITLKYTINALNYIEIYYQYNEVQYKYTQMHWKTFKYFGVFKNTSIYHYKYILIFWHTLKYLPNTLQSHKSYWLIKYLNPKLISRDIINTCWTYIRWSQKTIDNRKVVIRINDQKSEINETKRYMWRIVTFNSCVF